MAETNSTESNCPPLSLADRLKIYAAKYISGSQGGGGQGTGGGGGQGSSGMAQTLGQSNILEASDFFRFRAISTSDVVTVSYFGRLQRMDGSIVPFNQDLRTLVAGNTYTAIVPAGAGYLLGAAASVPINSISAGTVNAIGEIGRVAGSNFTPHTLLFSGEVDDTSPLTDGCCTDKGNKLIGSRLYAKTGSGTNPQQTVSFSVSNGKRTRITSVRYQVQAGAIAGLRFTQVTYTVGVTIIATLRFPGFYQVNDAVACSAYIGGSNTDSNLGGAPTGYQKTMGLPSDLYFYSDFDVTVGSAGVLAGDTMNTVIITAEET